MVLKVTRGTGIPHFCTTPILGITYSLGKKVVNVFLKFINKEREEFRER